MRIIAGKLGGRIFNSPSNKRVHPMSDKMRGALFNAVGDIRGLEILDAFGGSGAISFEAISRGAKFVTILDNDRRAQTSIDQNIQILGLDDDVKLIRSSISAWTRTSENNKFDIVIADPPYDNLQLSIISKLIASLKKDGLFALSYPGKLTAPEFSGMKLVKQNQYGDSQLVFYREVS